MSNGVTALDVAEAAYEQLLGMNNAWWWAVRSAELDTVAGEAKVRLPKDWGGIKREADQDVRIIILPDAKWMQYKHNVREQGGGSAQDRVARIGEDSDGFYLEFVNAFTKAKAGAYWITYYRAPMEVRDTSDVLPLPHYMSTAFLTLVRRIAKGWEEGDDVSLEALVDAFRGSSIYDAAVRADLRQRPKDIRRGAIGNAGMVRGQQWPFDNVVPPVIPVGGTDE